MYLQRKIDSYLISWKANPKHVPLLIKGPRQVGKTESILHFANANYEHVIYINFDIQKKYMDILKDGYEVNSIINGIVLHGDNFSFVPYKTILIFDEIQLLPDFLSTLKAFSLDGRYDVICSGSLLGIQYKRVSSVPVGYMDEFEMSSMDFEEYLWAIGLSSYIEVIFNHMEENIPFDKSELESLNSHFFNYVILGGMPAVIVDYLENGNISNARDMQKKIVSQYRADMIQYSDVVSGGRILEAFRSIPSQLAKENKKFQVKKIKDDKSARYKDYSSAIEWLIDAGIVVPCYCLEELSIPFESYYKSDKFKLYLRDSGLLLSMFDDRLFSDFGLSRNYAVSNGGFTENIIAEALFKSGESLYYFKRDTYHIEEEFLFETSREIIPIEVKAGTNRATSLYKIIESSGYPNVKRGIKLANGNIGFDGKVYTFPLFCAFLVGRFVDFLNKQN
ncbi:MAG: AAA family ATPase [Coprobacillus sp.]|nr:AAA family ATPase [Coprobacillus sp.]